MQNQCVGRVGQTQLLSGGYVQAAPAKKCNYFRMDVLIRQKRKRIQFQLAISSSIQDEPRKYRAAN